jgi:hypothetical protein
VARSTLFLLVQCRDLLLMARKLTVPFHAYSKSFELQFIFSSDENLLMDPLVQVLHDSDAILPRWPPKFWNLQI